MINTKQKFQLTSYLSQFANTVFLYIEGFDFFHSKIKALKKKNPKSKRSASECHVFGVPTG